MRYLALVAIALVMPAVVSADSVTVSTNADTVADSLNPNSTGNGGLLFVAPNTPSIPREIISYLSFDTSSLPPSGYSFKSATLWAYSYSADVGGSLGSAALSAYEVYGDGQAAAWTEGSLTYNNRPSATGSALATDIVSSSPPGWLSWDVTDAWAAVPYLDFAIMDTAPPPSQGLRVTGFVDRENAPGWGVAAPYLAITYDLPAQDGGDTPELPANALLGMSMIPMGFAWLRRRMDR